MGYDPDIVVIGASIIDVLARPASAGVFEKGTWPMEEIRMSVGGDAANEAVVLAHLKKAVQLETVFGKDRAGSFLSDYFKEKNVFVPEHAMREDIITGINIVLIDEQAERHFLTDPRGSLRTLERKHITMPFSESAKIVCFASVFVFPKILTEDLKVIFAQAKAQGKIVCADLTKRKNNETLPDMAEAFALVDYLLPNEEEAMLLSDTESPEEAADAFLKAGVKNVILKCGSRGCYVRNADEAYYVPAEKNVKCIDTTGAGDSFAAGFIAALSEGKTVYECARFANSCGAKAVQCTGATEWTVVQSHK